MLYIYYIRCKTRVESLLLRISTRSSTDFQPAIIYILLLPSIDNALEVCCLQRSATDKSAIDVRLSKEFLSVAWLAATAIEDACVLCNLVAILLSYDAADISVNFLCLV